MELKNNDGKYWIKAKEVEELYHDLTLELMSNIIRRLKERGTADLIDNPYIWQLEKLNDMHLLTEDNVKTIAKYSDISEDVFRDVIANEGYKIYKDSHEQLRLALKSSAKPDPKVQDSLNSLAKQTMREVNNLINTTMPKALQNNYKKTLESAVASVVSGTKSHNKALSEAVLKMYERGFTAFRDRGGKTWTVERYAQTVIRTTTFRTYREMRERSADELGVDTFYYSAKSSARELCAPLQHQIVTKGVARTIKGERVLSLPDYGYGSPGGCLGINCGHYLTPFVVGVNYKPDLPEYLKNLTEEEAMQNAFDIARLKAFDREIRVVRDKRRLVKELDDKELLQKLGLREKTLLGGRKNLIEKNPTVVGKYPTSPKSTTKKIISKTFLGDNIYKYLENEFGNINSGPVTLRKERLDHILNRHPDLGNNAADRIENTLRDPTYILKDNKNYNTVLFILKDEINNMNVVIKLSTDEKENSVITAFRVSDKRLNRVVKKTKILYNSSQIRYNDSKEE
ncbi:phage minor capsid protein [Gemella sp. Musashino-2025]